MWVIGGLVGFYLIARAIAEPFLIDMSDPATYRDDWGGPSLIGVLLVHCLPGILAVVVLVIARRRRLDHRDLNREAGERD